MHLIARYVALGGIWILTTYVAYIAKNNSTKENKLRVMSCRREIKRFSKLDEADKNSIF